MQRMIHNIIERHINLDQMLVVTFTNAAAAEMRERILEAIYQRLEETPEDVNLQKQLLLLPKANICTIHSFCLDVIRNHFYEIDVSANFRIGDQAELEILKQDVLEELFEDKYIKQEEDFLDLIHIYTSYRGDEALKKLILTIYHYIQSSPFPEEWLEEKCEMFDRSDVLDEDFSNTIWGSILMENFREEIQECRMELKEIQKDLKFHIELEKFSQVIAKDMEQMEYLLNITSWDLFYELMQQIKFDRWPTDKKVVTDLKEIAKEKRDRVKKNFTKIRDKVLIYTSKEANQDMADMYEILIKMKQLVLDFSEAYQEKKKEKNLIDFNDIEHLALKILVRKDEYGRNCPTEVAKQCAEKFKEIAIDEYQDSNLVQEYILSTISNGNNIFMVGDVKQSIYRFRQARPELFIEKYDTYQPKEKKQEKDHLKIQLFKNFRSRKNILDFTNLVFDTIMTRELGDVLYNETEYLNLGADFPKQEKEETIDRRTQIHIIDLKEENNKGEEDVEEDWELVENTMLEAKFVANQMKQILDSNTMVYDKKQGYRKVTYKDIVVLLRATSAQAPIYEKAIYDLGIPVFSDTSTNYLESIEIQTIMSLLKIIDNPMQDIPMVTVLRSAIGGFDDNELIEIRLNTKEKSFYESLLDTIKTSSNKKLQTKISAFLEKLEEFQTKQEYLPLDELIWNIYLETGYYHYVRLMPNGKMRQANLKMLFERAKQYESTSFKGLFYFIHFIDKLKVSSGDLSSAKLIGENEDVVRIMSIHKSKGLEFPIVFLGGTGKGFNLKDLNQNILLHQEIGFGPKYMNYERKIEYTTLAKEAIREVLKRETLSEEMRILYVALTRAKEQLYITGISKDYEKQRKEKEEVLRAYSSKDKLSKTVMKRYKSYLDWLELVYLNNTKKANDVMKIQVHKKEEILEKEEKEELSSGKIIQEYIQQMQEKEWKKEICQEWEEKINWKYYYQKEQRIPAKTSVSKIKRKEQEEQRQQQEHIRITERPRWIQGQNGITSAEKGTLMHLCMQRLNPKKEYHEQDIQKMLEEMVLRKMITEEQEKAIDVKKIESFTNSTLWKRMSEAKQIYQEKSFYINIPAKQLYPEVKDETEMILVQGMIDLYFIDKQDHIVLVDYKTDRVEESEQELIDKYQKQLELYQYAVEESIHKKVDEVYLYSTYLDKAIQVRFDRKEERK